MAADDARARAAPPTTPTTPASTSDQPHQLGGGAAPGAQQRLLPAAPGGAGLGDRGGQRQRQQRAGSAEEEEEDLRVARRPRAPRPARRRGCSPTTAAPAGADRQVVGRAGLRDERGRRDRAAAGVVARRRGSASTPGPGGCGRARRTRCGTRPAGSRTTLSGGATGWDWLGAPTIWKSESACGSSTTPATVTRYGGRPGPRDLDAVAGGDVQVGRGLLGEQDAVRAAGQQPEWPREACRRTRRAGRAPCRRRCPGWCRRPVARSAGGRRSRPAARRRCPGAALTALRTAAGSAVRLRPGPASRRRPGRPRAGSWWPRRRPGSRRGRRRSATAMAMPAGGGQQPRRAAADQAAQPEPDHARRRQLLPSCIRQRVRRGARATAGSWVATTSPAPRWSAASSRTSITRSPAARSSWPVGSSAKISCGRLASTRATATRWAWPPESSSGSLSASDADAEQVERRRRPAAIASLVADPASSSGKRDVLGGRQRRDQAEALEDHPGAGRVLERAGLQAGQVDRARGRAGRARPSGAAGWTCPSRTARRARPGSPAPTAHDDAVHRHHGQAAAAEASGRRPSQHRTQGARGHAHEPPVVEEEDPVRGAATAAAVAGDQDGAAGLRPASGSASSSRASVASSSSPVGSSASSTAGSLTRATASAGAGQLAARRAACGQRLRAVARSRGPQERLDRRRGRRRRSGGRGGGCRAASGAAAGCRTGPWCRCAGPAARRGPPRSGRSSGRRRPRRSRPTARRCPARQASSVDLPGPGGARQGDDLPGATSRETPCTASVSSSPAR